MSASTPLAEQLLAALRNKSPQAPSTLVAAVKGERVVVRKALQSLERAGQVCFTGATVSRQVHLGSAPAAASGPKPEALSLKPRAEKPATPLDALDERDRDVLKLVQNAGPGGRSVRELKIFRHDDTEEQIARALDRLKVKKHVKQDEENGRWVAA